jgi:predicted house-cleaning noncanonical NTP pyrophosphatase (MazG superfamily)
MIEDIDDGFPYEINYDQIMNVDTISATRDCARLVKSRSYITPGEYTSLLTTSQVEELVEIANDEEHEHFGELILISEMLSRAEGLDPSISMDETMTRAKMMIGFIVIESLDRKKLAIAHRKNFTFDLSLAHLSIAEKRPDVL